MASSSSMKTMPGASRAARLAEPEGIARWARHAKSHDNRSDDETGATEHLGAHEHAGSEHDALPLAEDLGDVEAAGGRMTADHIRAKALVAPQPVTAPSLRPRTARSGDRPMV